MMVLIAYQKLGIFIVADNSFLLKMVIIVRTHKITFTTVIISFLFISLKQVFVAKKEEENREIESRTKLVDGLKTALRTQPLR